MPIAVTEEMKRLVLAEINSPRGVFDKLSPDGKETRMQYEDLSPGARALSVALIGLPKHPVDRAKPDYLLPLLSNFAAVPDTVLLAVAAEIEDLAEAGELRHPAALSRVGRDGRRGAHHA
jgi:hypothetical protein